MTKAERPATPLQLIDHAQKELSTVNARWKLLSAFQEELHVRTKGDVFIIAGLGTWQALLDARDMMVVHFAQWAKSAYSPGGLFAQLQASPGHHFYVSAKPLKPDRRREVFSPKASDEDQDYLSRLAAVELHRLRRDRFATHFKAAAENGRKPNHADFQLLGDEFQRHVNAVVSDRDAHRAHPSYGFGASTATYPSLNLEQIQAHFDYAFGLLNDLRLLCDRTSVVDKGPAVQREAQDLVDQVLFGSRRRMDFLSGLSEVTREACGKYAFSFREELYSRLHADRVNAEQPFNHPDNLSRQSSV